MRLERTLEHLEHLVGFDTQNPPRDLTLEHPLFRYLREALGAGFELEVTDHGKGRITILAVRGTPRTLFNCHLDTVPASGDWSVPPLKLTVGEERAWGLGACDVKGAGAALLTLSQQDELPLALLFTTDEEGAEGCCVEAFVDGGGAGRFHRVVVCEPTGCRPVTRHRGYLSVRGRFAGTPGHSSEPRALEDSATHRLVQWGARAVERCRRRAEEGDSPRFNIGWLQGGVKSNVIAHEARVHWSARLNPGGNNEAFLHELTSLAPDDTHWDVPFSGPPLPASGRTDDEAVEHLQARGLIPGEPVHFWTEASLFSRGDVPAIVLGPGRIAQAHSADEWVALAELEEIVHIYRRLAEPHA